MTIQGSKVKYAKYIVPILQKCIDDHNITTFVDCCCGGANIIKNVKCDERIAIDKNKYLIALWQEIQKPNFHFPPFPNREDWDRCKNGLEPRDWYAGLTQIFASYFCRGFNAGYHKDEKKYWGAVHTCEKDIPLVQGIQFICDDYNRIATFKDTCIYLDPPYKDTKTYDAKIDYDDFWRVVAAASQDNWVFISEQSAPDNFVPIWTLKTTRSMRGKTTECIENLYVCRDGRAILDNYEI